MPMHTWQNAKVVFVLLKRIQDEKCCTLQLSLSQGTHMFLCTAEKVIWTLSRRRRISWHMKRSSIELVRAAPLRMTSAEWGASCASLTAVYLPLTLGDEKNLSIKWKLAFGGHWSTPTIASVFRSPHKTFVPICTLGLRTLQCQCCKQHLHLLLWKKLYYKEYKHWPSLSALFKSFKVCFSCMLNACDELTTIYQQKNSTNSFKIEDDTFTERWKKNRGKKDVLWKTSSLLPKVAAKCNWVEEEWKGKTL